MRKPMTEERRKYMSECMKRAWREGGMREKMMINHKTKIEASQTLDYTSYMRDYQKQFRENKKSYYRLRQLWTRLYKKRFEWRFFYELFKDMPDAKSVKDKIAELDINLDILQGYVPDYNV